MEHHNEDVNEATEGIAAEEATRSSELHRRGDVEKCPVCGSHVDAEAYHCATCHSYYCFHCRARLLPADTQLQCVNQQCDYYGKLTCSLCDPMAEQEVSPAVYIEPQDGYWPVWLVLVLVAAAITWFYTSLLTALLTAIIGFAVVGWLLQQLGLNLFGKEIKVEHPRTKQLNTCIRCHEQAKVVVDRRT